MHLNTFLLLFKVLQEAPCDRAELLTFPLQVHNDILNALQQLLVLLQGG